MTNFLKIGTGKVFVVIFLGLISLTSYFILFNYYNSISEAKADRLGKIQSISNTLSLSINGDSLKQLLVDYTYKDAVTADSKNAVYQKYQKLFKDCKELNEISSPIYTIHKNNHTGAFELGISSNDEPFFRHQYADPPEQLYSLYYTGGKIEKYKSENGEWLSAVSPIKTSEGEVVAAVEIDIPFDEFLASTRVNLLRNSMISLAIYLFIGILVFKFVAKVLKVEQNQKQQAEVKKNISEFKHKELGSSITYARRIQQALWPDNDKLRSNFSDFFSLNLPKDTVSGDFYWHHNISGTDKYIIIHADCTGHGVPGAMMSVLGNTIFNEVVVNYGITEPDQILFLTNKKLIKLLQQEKEENLDDGMAVSVVLVDKTEMTLKYAGANQNSVIIRNGQMIDLAGDKYPVGGAHYNPKRSYKSTTVLLEKDDALYLFSDGFKDQFGGPQNKKFLSSNFYKLLIEHSRKAMEIQKVLFLETFKSWKGECEQIDDVSLVGLKI